MITTCYGGRNRKIGIALAETEKPVSVLEGELLGGQSAQGVLTAAEVHSMLSSKKLDHQFPIFTTIHMICQRQAPADVLISCLRNHPEHN
ncbi:unnamed protein product [Dibothriocephalus latus]|uniref:Glycerol-3-phosphate dehydrogenase NAD-dependent C-terminal domain-containing protein n=1 Tax=Dibothriocephalus latus TaxID=60516 RepID=A0A3P7M944_DIBLA|nr:unnamed protein product [Dibothriocephalus latus]